MIRLHRTFQLVCAAGAGLCMAILFLSVFGNSLSRYAFGVSARWSEELPIYLTIYGVMFGIALAYAQDRHIRFTLLTDPLPDWVTARLFAAVDAVMVVLGGLLVVSALRFVESRGDVQASGLVSVARGLAEATGIGAFEWLGRMGTWQSAMILGGVLVAVAAILRLGLRLSETREA